MQGINFQFSIINKHIIDYKVNSPKLIFSISPNLLTLQEHTPTGSVLKKPKLSRFVWYLMTKTGMSGTNRSDLLKAKKNSDPPEKQIATSTQQ